MIGRNKQDGAGYLRRSTNRQEASLPYQLDWAIAQARQHEVRFDVSQADLEIMQARGLHKYKCLYLDDGVSGADLERPGLRALVEGVVANQNISHLFTYKRDRLGRPDDPLDMMTLESQLTRAGLTLVFNDSIATPTRQGETDLPHIVQMLFAYHQSGEFLRSLAERVIEAQRRLAREGHSTGGSPPYGFARYLVDPNGNVVEELEKGRTVRQRGYHVRWLPKDTKKIATWISILEMKEQGLGFKRIADALNQLGIPSPSAGMARRDGGVAHKVSGKWNHNTIADLCKNKIILGIKEFGRRSMGKHRRLGDQGPRLLGEDDRTARGNPRVIQNTDDVRITGPQEQEAHFERERWDAIQDQIKARSKSQKGVRRARDPGKYPLSCRVVDLTEHCGSRMYGVSSGDRRLYRCGRYQKGAGCYNNQIDAEALLRFLLKTVSTIVDRHGGRGKLRKLLEARAGAEENQPSPAERQLGDLDRQIKSLKEMLATAEDRLAFEKNDKIHAAIRRKYVSKEKELKEAELEKARLAALLNNGSGSPKQKVDAAIKLLDQVALISNDPDARQEVPLLLERLGIWIGLNYGQGIKGKKRAVRRLLGGQLSFGGYRLTVPLRGKDNRSLHQSGGGEEKCDCGSEGSGSDQGDRTTAYSASFGERPREGISSTKVSRGDRI